MTFHPPLFKFESDHHNHFNVVLPDHSPKADERCRDRSLRRNVCLYIGLCVYSTYVRVRVIEKEREQQQKRQIETETGRQRCVRTLTHIHERVCQNRIQSVLRWWKAHQIFQYIPLYQHFELESMTNVIQYKRDCGPTPIPNSTRINDEWRHYLQIRD
jgi:hypothetical protein